PSQCPECRCPSQTSNARTVDEPLSFLSGWRRVHHSKKIRFAPRAFAGAGFETSAHRLERFPRAANDGDVQSADSLLWSVMSTYVYRFVGLEALPGRLTDFDLQQFFQLGTGDVEAIRQRFRSDPLQASRTKYAHRDAGEDNQPMRHWHLNRIQFGELPLSRDRCRSRLSSLNVPVVSN
ncbi:hypothetical protein QTH97_30345, partial [Variovorax sp. J22R24]|uniref:hypothetical protein n=1 Tax=Variovorax gracilis TaxID=3053502 RepID=UPI002576DE18